MWDTGRLVEQVVISKLQHFVATCMWVYTRLDGPMGSECLPVVVYKISRLGTPSARAADLGQGLPLYPVLTGASCVLRNREQDERPAGGREKVADAPITSYYA